MPGNNAKSEPAGERDKEKRKATEINTDLCVDTGVEAQDGRDGLDKLERRVVQLQVRAGQVRELQLVVFL